MGENLTLQPSSISTRSVFKKPFSTFNRNVLLARKLKPTTQEEKRLYDEIQEEFRKITPKEWSAMDEIEAPLIDDHRPIVSYSMEIRREVEEAYEDTNAENIDEEDVLEEHAMCSWPRFVTFRRHIESIAADSTAAVSKLKMALLELQLYQFQKLEISKPKGNSKSWAQVIRESITTLVSHLLLLERAMKRFKPIHQLEKSIIVKHQSIIVRLILIPFRCPSAAYEIDSDDDRYGMSIRS
ncbi:hypothetical protein JCM5350_003945 [Sporobolomyces pararoseus]